MSENKTSDVKNTRLVSLDALRGFDMLWIIGMDKLIRALAESLQWPWLKTFAHQLEHPEWTGFAGYDLIFPLFLFIVGVAIPFSLSSKSEHSVAGWRLYMRIFRRMALLILFGVIYNGGLAFAGIEKTRFASVLGLIGVGYFFAAIIVMNFNARGQILWFLGILLGYWMMLTMIPVPQFGAGVLTPEGSLPGYIDRHLLPGRLHGGVFDPEGIMCCISAICTALAGAITGQWLRKQNVIPLNKAVGMLIAGATAVLVGLLWNRFLPFNKHLWTGSFVVLTTGLSLILLGIFYLVIDVLGWKKWTLVFTVIGVNSITIYMAAHIIDFEYTTNFIFGGVIQFMPEAYRKSLLYLGIIIVEWLLLYGLYRKKIFLRL